MTRLDFDRLVRRTEARYANRPAALRRAATLWVDLGLAGIVAWVILLLVLGAGGLVVGALNEPPAGIVFMVVGVVALLYGVSQAAYILNIEPRPRSGYLLTPAEAPALHAVLESLRAELQCRPFDEVRVTSDFNACVLQVPRLGLLGWPRTLLEIGLPLAYALSPQQLRAVLAHEFAHVCERHASSGGRLFLLRATWHDLLQKMQNPPRGSLERAVRLALAKFLDWYWPRLDARLLVLSRVHEYDADREAARLAGTQEMVEALWRLECLTPWLVGRFWPDVFQKAVECPEPPADVLRIVGEGCAHGPFGDVNAWVQRGLSRATACDDTHPAFVDRARQFGWNTDDCRRLGFPMPVEPSSAEVYLGPGLPRIERLLSEEWQRSALGTWRERHRQANAQRKREQAAQADVTQRAAESASSSALQALWESAQVAARTQGLVSAEPLLWKVLGSAPTHAGASALLGAHLARAGEPKGEQLLRAVVERGDEDWLPAACQALEQYYQAIGRMDLVHQTRARLDGHEAEVHAAGRERSAITARDRFVAHSLTDDSLRALQSVLGGTPRVARAWLARKELKHFPHRPLFVLCVASSSSERLRGGADDTLVRELVPKVQLPGQHLVIARHGSFRRLAKKLMSLPDAEIYPPQAAGALDCPKKLRS